MSLTRSHRRHSINPDKRMSAMTAAGTSRHFAAAQQFGRFRSEADIESLTEPDL